MGLVPLKEGARDSWLPLPVSRPVRTQHGDNRIQTRKGTLSEPGHLGTLTADFWASRAVRSNCLWVMPFCLQQFVTAAYTETFFLTGFPSTCLTELKTQSFNKPPESHSFSTVTESSSANHNARVSSIYWKVQMGADHLEVTVISHHQISEGNPKCYNNKTQTRRKALLISKFSLWHSAIIKISLCVAGF